MNKQPFIKLAIAWVERKPSAQIKAKAEGYEEPKSFFNKTTLEEIQPDISFITHGGAKHYTEITIKTEDPRKQVSKWKLLSLMASMKRGKLHLLAPKGNKMFTQNLVKKHNINAFVYSI